MATSADPELAAARLLLSRLGLRPEQLLDGAPSAEPVPTFDEYIDRVSEAVNDGTRRAYSTYWEKIRAAWGPRRLDDPTATEVNTLACPRPRNTPHWRPHNAPLMATVLPSDGQIPPR